MVTRCLHSRAVLFHRLLLVYLLALVAIYATAIATFLVSVWPAELVIVSSLVFFITALTVVLSIEPGQDFVSSGDLEGLLALKRNGALLRHAARIRTSRARTGNLPGRPSPTDTPLNRLTRLKGGLRPL